jgi:hypothetical protein
VQGEMHFEISPNTQLTVTAAVMRNHLLAVSRDPPDEHHQYRNFHINRSNSTISAIPSSLSSTTGLAIQRTCWISDSRPSDPADGAFSDNLIHLELLLSTPAGTPSKVHKSSFRVTRWPDSGSHDFILENTGSTPVYFGLFLK